MNRRPFVLGLSSVFATSHFSSVFAQSQALLNAKIVSGFPPGGTVDVLARRTADKLRGTYATNVIVENKPGAAGQIGVMVVKDAPGDGSAILLTPSSMLSIYPFTYPKLQYKLNDLTPVSTGAWIHHGLAVGPAVPASVRTLAQFLTWTKANPAQANFGSPGAGSMPHLIGILLNKLTMQDIRHIPYRGTVPGVQDLLGGQIAAFCGPIGDYIPHVKTGKLRVLAVSGRARSPFLPDSPTYRELGYPISVREWYGYFMSGSTPSAIVRRASEQIQQVMKSPDLIEFGKGFGLEIQGSSSSNLAELVKADAEEWRRLIKQIGFTAES